MESFYYLQLFSVIDTLFDRHGFRYSLLYSTYELLTFIIYQRIRLTVWLYHTDTSMEVPV